MRVKVRKLQVRPYGPYVWTWWHDRCSHGESKTWEQAFTAAFCHAVGGKHREVI